MDESTDAMGDGDSAQKHTNASATPEQFVRNTQEPGAWGRQLVELQRAQLVRHLQAVAR